jgi:hypothetical protein
MVVGWGACRGRCLIGRDTLWFFVTVFELNNAREKAVIGLSASGCWPENVDEPQ